MNPGIGRHSRPESQQGRREPQAAFGFRSLARGRHASRRAAFSAARDSDSDHHSGREETPVCGSRSRSDPGSGVSHVPTVGRLSTRNPRRVFDEYKRHHSRDCCTVLGAVNARICDRSQTGNFAVPGIDRASAQRSLGWLRDARRIADFDAAFARAYSAGISLVSS